MNDREYLIAARVLDSRDVRYDFELTHTGDYRIYIPLGGDNPIEISRNTTIGELYAIVTLAQPKPWS
jgi:hypothetical protein